jgi:hypothetical protein
LNIELVLLASSAIAFLYSSTASIGLVFSMIKPAQL